MPLCSPRSGFQGIVYFITFKKINGSVIQVYLNNGKVVDINLSEWKELGKNPDGTKNKLITAYKDMPREGKIGFQDHEGKVWYKNIRISKL